MSAVSTWVSVTREDGETVGYLEPLTEDYARVRPRSLLGHPVAESAEFIDGEELLIERGIAELAERWTLRDAQGEQTENLTIVELSQRGIVLMDYMAAKALYQDKKIVVEWPDLEQRLRLAASSR